MRREERKRRGGWKSKGKKGKSPKIFGGEKKREMVKLQISR
jgi:hypothetical protein